MSFPTKVTDVPTEQEIWEYATRILSDPTELETSASTRYITIATALGLLELEEDALTRYTALVAALAAIPTTPVLTAHFDIAEFETEWITDPNVNSVSSAAEANLTEGDMGTITYPTGATEVRVTLLPIIKAVNQSGATHHIGITVQYSEDDGGWADIIDLTADPPMGLVVLDGAGDAWAQPLDVSAIVETGKKYEFRFQVDSDNAGEVHYTTSFVLVLIYKMG